MPAPDGSDARASALDGSAPVFVPLTALTLRARAPDGSDARASAPTAPTPNQRQVADCLAKWLSLTETEEGELADNHNEQE